MGFVRGIRFICLLFIWNELYFLFSFWGFGLFILFSFILFSLILFAHWSYLDGL